MYRCGKVEPLQVATEAGELAIVRAEADQGERFKVTQENDFMQHPNGGEAAFLLGKHGSGFCLIDQLLSWDWDQMGRIEERYEASSARINDQVEVEVVTEHVSRLELDQDEVKDNVDDLRYATCGTSRFTFRDGRYRRLRAQVVDGLCPGGAAN